MTVKASRFDRTKHSTCASSAPCSLRRHTSAAAWMARPAVAIDIGLADCQTIHPDLQDRAVHFLGARHVEKGHR